MKRIQLFALAAALMMAAACNNDISDVGGDISPTEPTSEQMPEVTFTPEEMGYLTELANGTPKISVDSAAKVALQVMGNRLSKSTLSVTAFGTPKEESLSKSFFDSDIDTTLYVFNAPSGNGFAVISADARIPQQVLAYSENGNLELDSDNPAFDVFLSYATDYAAECIAKAQEQRDSIENSILEKLGIEAECDAANSLSKTKRVIQRFLLTSQCYDYTQYETQSEVKPLIKTNWSQKAPYNDKMEHPASCKRGYAAGCIPVAVAQLMVYWRYPQKIDGTKIDWNLLSNDNNCDKGSYNNQASLLVKAIGSKSIIAYGCSESPAIITKALSFLRSNGYDAPSYMTAYKYNKVISNLGNGHPVLMGGGRDISTSTDKNHSNLIWLADGYIHQKKIVTSSLTYVVVEIDDETGKGSCRYEHANGSKGVTELKYLHINWGSGPENNGYFVKDVFDVNEKYILGNDGGYVRSPTGKEYNYCKNLQIADGISR